ncbi:MAG: hypothetical protein N3E52_06480 [Candidatus Bathyarchaeota archaeon]|nr:hypothetical protein [Candidatus Bathyarchaeota archaeon]
MLDIILALTSAFAKFFESITQMDIIALVALIIIGVIIILLIKLLIMLIPAILLALVVWFFTGSLFWAGITFLVIASLSILKKL